MKLDQITHIGRRRLAHINSRGFTSAASSSSDGAPGWAHGFVFSFASCWRNALQAKVNSCRECSSSLFGHDVCGQVLGPRNKTHTHAHRKTMLLDRLLRRGLISGIYPESQEYREKLRRLLVRPVAVYTGFDATSSSLHVGNLATIVSSLYFYSHGHQVICVIGDATAQIGDPAGHTRDRRRMDKTVISDNAESLEATLRTLFDNYRSHFFGGGTSARNQHCPPLEAIKPPIFLRNSEWYQDRNVIDFIDEVFREVRVGGLLHKKSIQDRLKTKEGMNMAEFSYQIFQAFDWLELTRRHNCLLQIGGNDQQGNIYTGHDLIKKRLKRTDSIGLLAPLITNNKGKKLGKTTEKSNSAIWLHPNQTSPFDLYQFFHRTPDSDVEKFLKVFSFHDEDRIDELIKTRLGDKSDIWHCQRKLAEHVCLLVHGRDGLEEARVLTESTYHKK